MKTNKIKTTQYTIISFIVLLGSLLTLGPVVLNKQNEAIASTTTLISPVTPTFVSPIFSQKYTGMLPIIISAPGSFKGKYTFYLGDTKTNIKTDLSSTNGSGYVEFTPLDIGSCYGPYRLMATVYYDTSIYNVASITVDDPLKYILINKDPLETENQTYCSHPTTTTTSSTTTTTKGTAIVPTTTTTTINGVVPVSTTKDDNISNNPSDTSVSKDAGLSLDSEMQYLENSGMISSGSNFNDLYDDIIDKYEESKLPDELKNVPESIVLKTETAEVTMTDITKGKVKFIGKAEPNQTVWLYIFSDPVVVSVNSDDNGDWEYSLDQELDTGNHKIYVAVKNDDNTVKAKSSVFNFIVGEAIAASSMQNQTGKSANSSSSLFYYIIFAVSIVTLIISAIFFILTKKRIKLHLMQIQSEQ